MPVGIELRENSKAEMVADRLKWALDMPNRSPKVSMYLKAVSIDLAPLTRLN